MHLLYIISNRGTDAAQYCAPHVFCASRLLDLMTEIYCPLKAMPVSKGAFLPTLWIYLSLCKNLHNCTAVPELEQPVNYSIWGVGNSATVTTDHFLGVCAYLAGTRAEFPFSTVPRLLPVWSLCSSPVISPNRDLGEKSTTLGEERDNRRPDSN